MEEEELVRGVSSLGLADAAEPGPSAVVAPRPAASSAPDGGSPGSGRSASGFHTGVKQVQWASAFGADDGGLDPFSDLSGRGADVFLGDVNQSLVVAGSNAGLVSDHGFFGGNQSLATEEVRDQDFYWGISRRHALFVGILVAEEAEAASDTRQ